MLNVYDNVTFDMNSQILSARLIQTPTLDNPAEGENQDAVIEDDMGNVEENEQNWVYSSQFITQWKSLMSIK